MSGWMVRTVGRLSQWGSYITHRPPKVTPEIAESLTRPPHLFKSDKAIRELGYRAMPMAAMIRESCEWLDGERLLD
jgi:hypothetical protein